MKKSKVAALTVLTAVSMMTKTFAQNKVFNSEYDKLLFPIANNVQGGITGDDYNYKKLTLFHGNAIVFQTGTNEPNYVYNRMVINPDGKVGIGTPSPGDQLTVQDAIRVSTSNGSGGFFAADAAAAGNYIFSLTRQGNNLGLSAWDGIGFAAAARSGPSSAYQMFIHPNGNVGIGTSNPGFKLHIKKNDAFGDINANASTIDHLLLLQAPYQTSAPQSNNGTGYKWGIKFFGANEIDANYPLKTSAIYAVSEDGQLGYNRAVGLAFHTSAFDSANGERLRITSTGKVGIGTSIPDAKLTVKGKIHAEEVKIDLSVPAPDYVFEKKYSLLSLSALDKFLKTNRHLPGVPAAKVMEREGVDLGVMNMKLLQKVEELTLYLIEKDRQLLAEQKTNQLQKRQIHSLAKLLQHIDQKINHRPSK